MIRANQSIPMPTEPVEPWSNPWKQGPKPIKVRLPSAAEEALKAALQLSKQQGHTRKVAEACGVWPA